MYDKIRAGDFIFNVMSFEIVTQAIKLFVTDQEFALVVTLDIVFPFAKNLHLRNGMSTAIFCFVYLSSKQAFEDQMDYVSNQMAANSIKICIRQRWLEQYKKLVDMDDGDECTGTVRTSVGVPCHHEIKRRIEENGRFKIWRYSLSICICMHHLLFLHVAMRIEPFSFQRKNLMQSIKLRLYEANDDQTAVVMARLDEASQTPLQLFSSSALATKRGLSSRVHTKRKAIPARKIIL
ncbi:hypothetical protein BASA83_007779 [Batrachochytrium salamandrivorans]|nr:hypothetical protein BASA83_007779 [Batrachochytrium salamandrivorans]